MMRLITFYRSIYLQDPSKFPELGEIASDRVKGRKSAESITICDLTGTGVQDTAIATLVRQRADKSGAGTDFNN